MSKVLVLTTQVPIFLTQKNEQSYKAPTKFGHPVSDLCIYVALEQTHGCPARLAENFNER